MQREAKRYKWQGKSGKWHLKFMRKHGQCLSCLSLVYLSSLISFFFWKIHTTALQTPELRPKTQHADQHKDYTSGKNDFKNRKRKKLMLEKYVCELATRHCLYSVCFLTHLFSTFSFQFPVDSFQFFFSIASSHFHEVLVAVKWAGHV